MLWGKDVRGKRECISNRVQGKGAAFGVVR